MMVKIHKYNYDDVSEYDVAEMLLELIVDKLETSKYETMPKQKDVIHRLRNSGWDEKVTVGEHCRHSIDGILEGVGVCAYFGHSQGAFQKLLALQSLYEDGLITQCYYITQTTETAELRHKLINPQSRPGSNGNRITFDEILSGMGYYSRFITVPMTVIGIEIGEENFSE